MRIWLKESLIIQLILRINKSIILPKYVWNNLTSWKRWKRKRSSWIQKLKQFNLNLKISRINKISINTILEFLKLNKIAIKDELKKFDKPF